MAEDTPQTGIPEIDAEHIMQIRLLLAIEKALEGANRTAALELMSRFDDFANAHFASEQTLMRLYSFPGHAAHESEHQQLLDELRQLSKRVAVEDMKSLPGHAAALRTWLVSHMQTSDRQYAAFVRQIVSGVGSR